MATAAQRKAQDPAGLAINKTFLPYALDKGIGPRARIGLVVLATDHAVEQEFRDILRLDGVAHFASRMYNSATITAETLRDLAKDVTRTAALILPGDRLDVMAFACTSGAMVMGLDKVETMIREARPGIPVTTPMGAAVAGMQALGLRRVALLTPYVQELNDMMRATIEAAGIAVPAMGSFNNSDDLVVANISPATIRDAAAELVRESGADGVFVSCTGMRAAGVIEAIEAATGKPALASNHAMAWHALRLAGIKDVVPGFGRLLRI